MSTGDSDVCGTKTSTESEWISVKGPVKGSYAIIYATDALYNYVSDFGMRVEDPCKAQDDDLYINLTPGNTTEKDLKYYQGTNSSFWIPQCKDLRALRLTEAFSFVEVDEGRIVVHSMPPDLCTKLEVKHRAPDNTIFTNVFYLKMQDKYSARIEKCTP